MDISLSDIANYAQIASIPLAILTWLVTREKFARFWRKWLPFILFFVIIVGFIGLWKLGYLKWFQYQSTWPVWALILLSMSGLIVISLILFVINSLSKESYCYTSYVSDTIFEIAWHWHYSSGKLSEDNLAPICPNKECSCQLEPIYNSAYRAVDFVTLVCDHCGFEKRFDCNWEQLKQKVAKEVDRRIRTLLSKII